jgi:hypothetical protein
MRPAREVGARRRTAAQRFGALFCLLVLFGFCGPPIVLLCSLKQRRLGARQMRHPFSNFAHFCRSFAPALRDQAAFHRHVLVSIDGRYLMARRQLDDRFAMDEHETVNHCN